MTPLFPAIKAECLVVLYAPDDTVRVTVDWHDRDVDVESFVALAILNLLLTAKRAGKNPQLIVDCVSRMAGETLR